MSTTSVDLSSAQEPAPATTRAIEAPSDHLDLATVIKVSQTISGEIVLEKLIDTLMRTALEHAGAERGLVILTQGAKQWIAAEATISRDTVSVCLREDPVSSAALPESVLHSVAHTQQSVILDDASVANHFS